MSKVWSQFVRDIKAAGEATCSDCQATVQTKKAKYKINLETNIVPSVYCHDCALRRGMKLKDRAEIMGFRKLCLQTGEPYSY